MSDEMINHIYDQERCRQIRSQLNLTKAATKGQPGNKDAGVLILLHDDGKNVKVFLCVRSKNLRRHPGEVCFPGGMLDEQDGNDLRRTAFREAFEEVGIREDDCQVVGSLPVFRAKFGVLIHPTVALLKRPLNLVLNEQEVQSVFWLPLHRFLDNQCHSMVPIDDIYRVHLFQFVDAPLTFGITALLCIIVAIGVQQRRAEFQIVGNLAMEQMENMQLSQIIRHVSKYTGVENRSSKL